MPRMLLNGTAMSGGRDHGAVSAASFLGPAVTAARYRFIAVDDDFPGLLPMGDGGFAITGELYELTETELFDGLLPEEPPELELGTIELADGSIVNSMLLAARAAARRAEGRRHLRVQRRMAGCSPRPQ